MAEKLLTIREVSHLLGISEKEVIDLAEKGEIPAYKVGGLYLRFKKDQVEHLKGRYSHVHLKDTSSFFERIKDFFYFNDFYVLAVIVIFVILVVIFKG
ncbi:MAG: helix-turn-helix domain-containing protein [Candidatus Omnitrophota bacterium]